MEPYLAWWSTTIYILFSFQYWIPFPYTYIMYLSLKFLTPWGSLLPIPPSSPHLLPFFQYLQKPDSPLPLLPHLTTPSLKVNLVTKGLNWNVELTSLPLTQKFISAWYISLIFIPSTCLFPPFYLLFSVITNIPSVLPADSWFPLDSSGSSQAGSTLPHNHLASCQTHHADPVGVASWQQRSTWATQEL